MPCPPARGPQVAGSGRWVMLAPNDITISQSEDGPAGDHIHWDPLLHSVLNKQTKKVILRRSSGTLK